MLNDIDRLNALALFNDMNELDWYMWYLNNKFYD